jgi:uncharacterized phage protein (TIGR02218 family)
MKTASAALQAWLAANNQGYAADLLCLDLPRDLGTDAAKGVGPSPLTTGSRCCWTTGDTDLVVPNRNLLLWSEDFTNAAWVKTGVTAAAPVVTPNVGRAPVGSLWSVDTVVFGDCSAAGRTSTLSQVVAAMAAGGTFTLSFWARKISGAGVYIVTHSLHNGAGADYNPILMTTTPTRYSATFTVTAGSNGVALGPMGESGFGSIGVELWGAQVVPGSQPAPYESTAGTTTTTYSSSGPPWKRGAVRQAEGIEINTMDLTLQSAGWTFPSGKTLAQAAMEGALDGALVSVKRLYMPTWADYSLGYLTWFSGQSAAPEGSSVEVKLQFKSGLEKLNVSMPKRTYQASCPYALFDGACGVSRVLNTHYWNVAVASAPAPTTLAFALSGNRAVDSLKLGSVLFTSGALKGLSRPIASSLDSGANHVVTLNAPLPSAPAVGDTFTVTVGCDKQFSTCVTKFSNGTRHGGYPYVPKPESIR